MSQYFELHSDNPQARLVRRTVEILRGGGLIAYPTDSCYALGCTLGNKEAAERIRRLRRTDKEHIFTLVCRDLSEIATYARISNSQYRLLRSLTPGPYTFVLQATHEVPRRLLNPKRRTIGIRVPDSAIVRSLLDELGEPIMSTTLILPGSDLPLTDPQEIRERLEHQVDLVVGGGVCFHEATSVLDLLGEQPMVLRKGRGQVDFLESPS
jgi:tRNA threonylcarbamoyl adenosine modification protein (Sua5/YciO/YrdC/YwlC family)